MNVPMSNIVFIQVGLLNSLQLRFKKPNNCIALLKMSILYSLNIKSLDIVIKGLGYNI